VPSVLDALTVQTRPQSSSAARREPLNVQARAPPSLRKHNPETVGLRQSSETLRRGSQIAAVTFPEGWKVNRV
jgi:hypothetical protein